MKQYAVEILERHTHGIYGKERYTVWCLSETSKKGACSFALEIVAGMTWRQILTEKYGEGSSHIQKSPYMSWKCELDDVIGYENANNCFSYRATLMQ